MDEYGDDLSIAATGAIEKKGRTDEVRVIFDGSHGVVLNPGRCCHGFLGQRHLEVHGAQSCNQVTASNGDSLRNAWTDKSHDALKLLGQRNIEIIRCHL